MFVRNNSRIRLGLKCPFLIRLFHGKRGFAMDFLTGNIKTIYFKYLSAAFGSTLISCMGAVELQKNIEEQERQQKIEIYYDGAGFIPLNLFMQRETA